MNELTMHPDPGAPARLPRGIATPRCGTAAPPASLPGIEATFPRVYAQRVEGGPVFEIHRGLAVGADRIVFREQRAMGDGWHVWAAYRSRRMLLPR